MTDVHQFDEKGVGKLAAVVLSEALDAGASELFVDPRSDHVLVTMRVDGRLREQARLPPNIQRTVTNYFRELVGLTAATSVRAARGHRFVEIDGRTVDVQVATFPGTRGESVTVRMRPLDQQQVPLDKLYSAAVVERVRATLEREQYGMVLVAGPSFSGKSTVLFAILLELLDDNRRVMTIEDPVMHHVDNVVQAYVTDDFSMADALRAMEACDADVALASQLQTAEEIRLAFDVARMSYMLSIIHAEDSVHAIATLLQAGWVSPETVAESVILVTAQRLVRRSCPDCRTMRPATADEAGIIGLGAEFLDRPFVVNTGCDRCDGSGYSGGRMAVSEALSMTPALEAAIRSGTRDAAGIRRALGPTFRTIDDDLRAMLLEGEISLDEAVLRLTPRFELSSALTALVDEVEAERPEISVGAIGGTVTIVFTDIANSTELTARSGDGAWVEALRHHRSLVHKHVEAYGGTEVKSTGDGFMLAFPTANGAVRCGIAIRDSAAATIVGDGSPLAVKVGIHAGEPVRDGDDFYGTTVNIAARLASAAVGGEVLVSRLVRGLIADSKGFAFGSAREVELKGVDGAQTLYPVELASP